MKRRSAIARYVVIAWLFGVVAMHTAPAAWAQPRWGRPNVPRAGACFYRDANFQGDYFCSSAGEELPAIANGMNDEISSIRTFGGAEVTIFQNSRFGGRSARFTEVRNLREAGWNDRLSSLRVNGGFARGRDRVGGGNGDSRFRADADRIVRRAYQDILRREPDSDGLREYRIRIIDDHWTEAEVREALRNSREYREQNRMTRTRAQEIVRQAYLSVLNREPDSASQTYVDKVLRERWTEQDVARELRKSAEFRSNRSR